MSELLEWVIGILDWLGMGWVAYKEVRFDPLDVEKPSSFYSFIPFLFIGSIVSLPAILFLRGVERLQIGNYPDYKKLLEGRMLLKEANRQRYRARRLWYKNQIGDATYNCIVDVQKEAATNFRKLTKDQEVFASSKREDRTRELQTSTESDKELLSQSAALLAKLDGTNDSSGALTPIPPPRGFGEEVSPSS